jgi:hypothetical protein
MLEEVFRGIIDVRNTKGDRTIPRDALLRNFRNFQKSKVICSEASYSKMYHYILDFYRKYQDLPAFDKILDYFTREEGDSEVILALGRVKEQKPYDGANYRSALESTTKDQSHDALLSILSTGQEILVRGKKDGKVQLKGLEDAVKYLNNSSRQLVLRNADFKLESQIRSQEDVNEELQEYDKMAGKATEGAGVMTWLDKIDGSRGGLKHTELMLVAAFTGQFKTTFTMNMAYRAVFSGFNVGFVSLEMSHKEMRTKFYVLHTCNPIFLDSPYADQVGKITLNDVVYGRLTPRAHEFYKYALNDFCSNPEYGRLLIWQPDASATSIDDINAKFLEFDNDLKNEARALELGCIDYLTLLAPPASAKRMDPNEALNECIKQTKRLCLTFNNGQGLRIISPFQTNRKGYEEALKNSGIYQLMALSNAHEAERSADLVVSLFAGEDQRDRDVIKICCLKDRRHKPFKPFECAVRAESGNIFDIAGRAEEEALDIDFVKLREEI